MRARPIARVVRAGRRGQPGNGRSPSGFSDDRIRFKKSRTHFLRAVVQDARAARGLPPEVDWAE